MEREDEYKQIHFRFWLVCLLVTLQQMVRKYALTIYPVPSKYQKLNVTATLLLGVIFIHNNATNFHRNVRILIEN